jgi:predicted permease
MVQGRTHRMTEVVARVEAGVSLQQATTEVTNVYSRMVRDHPETYDAASHYRVSVIPFKAALGERAQLTLWLLMGAAALVLIISAASVTNLTLMRGVGREQELVVRAALGAGVARLRRMLLVENLLLTFTGAAIGTIVAVAGVRMLTSFAARYSVRANEIRLDFVVLGFTVALSVGIAMLLSWLAFVPRESTLGSIVSAGSRRSTGGLRRNRLQRGLVVAQIAVSVVLLAGAGLLTRTMIQLADVRTGLKTEQVLSIDVSLISPAVLVSDDRTAIMRAAVAAQQGYARMEADARAIPGVVDAGVGSTMPLHTGNLVLEVKREDRGLSAGEAPPRAEYRTADPSYFRAAGMPLVKGRAFDATDAPGGARVVVMNQTLADRLFPNEDPIGKRVAWTGDVLRFTPITPDWRTVVGVVANTQDGGLDAKPIGVMYQPFSQELALGGTLVIRADSNIAALTAAATRIVNHIAPDVPIEHVETVAQIKDESVSPRKLNAALVSSFGILAVIIAAVGIAGVLAFSVTARTNEIGIRMSLGADRARVQWMILREGGSLVVLGLALGVAGAYFGAGVMRGLLFGIAPHDPTTFVVVSVAMATIGILACWIPALRAARIDPAITMRAMS